METPSIGQLQASMQRQAREIDPRATVYVCSAAESEKLGGPGIALIPVQEAEMLTCELVWPEFGSSLAAVKRVARILQ